MLKVENVSKIYKTGEVETIALKDINLEVQKGAFMVFSGPSGSGKTTLLNIIGGLDAPASGKVILDGKEISTLKESQLSKERLKHIGFVFQAYNLIQELNAKENIEYIMTLQGVGKEERDKRTSAVAGELGIENLLEKKPSQMSGGQQQRVAVARAVVSKPKLILADEPTANLDSKNAIDLMEMMKELNEKEGVTIIFSSHDPLVIQEAKQHVILKDGKIFKIIEK